MSQELLRCRRRANGPSSSGPGDFSLPHPPPVTVARRNERERNRVRLVNHGFATLRQHVPHGTKRQKMSKVDTLRSAVDYIKQLQQLLQNPDTTPATLRQTMESFHQENANPAPHSQSSRSPSPSTSVGSNYCSSPEGTYSSLKSCESASYTPQASYVSGPGLHYLQPTNHFSDDDDFLDFQFNS